MHSTHHLATYSRGFGGSKPQVTAEKGELIVDPKVSIWKNWKKALKPSSGYYRDLVKIDQELEPLLRSVEEAKTLALGSSAAEIDILSLLDRCKAQLDSLTTHDETNRNLWAHLVEDLQKLMRLQTQQYDKLREIPDKYILAIGINETPVVKLPGAKIPKASDTWAVVIGIDNYLDPDTPNAVGAVNDARSVVKFFVQNGIPVDHIRHLIGPVATRSAILDTLDRFLSNNPDITKNSPIYMYFAGYGSRYNASEMWPESREFVEALCPVDRGVGDITDISNCELYYLLRNLCTKRGDGITLILDCCHIGGEPHALVTREFRSAQPLAGHLGRMLDCISDRYGLSKDDPIFDAKWRQDPSVTVVSACLNNERAWYRGDKKHGWFTDRMIEELSEDTSITFRQLVEKIGPLPSADYPRQHPVTYGSHVDRRVFPV